ncbi:MAG: hypothetical protein HC899_37570 [Leptolyngbyaceae cyanobacterium SM1_4_3]|nr:hypothetical protein [Leptolyngbyaceae cyanobacterium SM1_4_3]
MREVEGALAAERQANQILKEAEQRAKRTIRRGVIGLAGISAVALVIVVWAGVSLRNASATAEAARLESREAKQQQEIAEATAEAANEQVKSAGAESTEARRNTSQANQQTRLAETAAQEARAEQTAAQAAAASARQQQEAAQTAEAAARAEQRQATEQAAAAEREREQALIAIEQAQTAGRLERRGTALLRYQPVRFVEIETLLQAMELGQELKNLMQASPNPVATNTLLLEDYPAISPLLALRTAVNSVLEWSFQGAFRGFSDDGQRLVSYSNADNTSRLYDLSGTELGSFQGAFRGFSDDGQRLVTSLQDEDISKVYDLSGNLLAEFTGSTFDSNPNRRLLRSSLGFSPDGQRLMTVSGDGYIRLWPIDNGLDDLLAQGCERLEGYFRANPEERLEGCPEG